MRDQPLSELLDEVLTVDEVASLLRVERKSVYRAVASGELPGRRFGRTIRFSKKKVMAWLEDDNPTKRPRSRRW